MGTYPKHLLLLRATIAGILCFALSGCSGEHPWQPYRHDNVDEAPSALAARESERRDADGITTGLAASSLSAAVARARIEAAAAQRPLTFIRIARSGRHTPSSWDLDLRWETSIGDANAPRAHEVYRAALATLALSPLRERVYLNELSCDGWSLRLDMSMGVRVGGADYYDDVMAMLRAIFPDATATLAVRPILLREQISGYAAGIRIHNIKTVAAAGDVDPTLFRWSPEGGPTRPPVADLVPCGD